MKHIFDKLDNKVLESRVRLGIMSMLMVEDWVHYSAIKKSLGSKDKPLSDGNLASHLKKLREAGYLKEKKQFVNRRPHTTYQATTQGRKAFEAYLEALEALLKEFD